MNILNREKIKIITGDGREGYSDWAPYDVIHVGAAAPEVPKSLIQQLSIGGAMVIPVGKEYGWQNIYLIKKISEDEVEKENMLDVTYIPFCDKDYQLKKRY